MEFEFDAAKSAANQAKHGLDFIAAQELWNDAMQVEIPARTADEARWLVIGLIGSQHWPAVVTYRQDRTRIISVRRSRAEGVTLYEG